MKLSLAASGAMAAWSGSITRADSFVPFVTDSTHIQAAVLNAAANFPANAGTVYDPSGNTNDIQIVNFGSTVYTGPVDVSSTLNRIRQNDSVHPDEANDGGFFNFNPGELPNVPRMGANYYMEIMVWPNMDLAAKTFDTTAQPYPGVSFPGPMRLLIGSQGEAYFSGDHYSTNDYVYPTAPPAPASTIDTWNTTSNGTWNVGSNWSTSSVPGSGQAAYLTATDTKTRTVTYSNSGGAGMTLADLLVNADGTSSTHGSFTLTQAQDTLLTQKEEIWARYATAAVIQSGGTQSVSGSMQIAPYAASVGSYTLSGSGSVLSSGNEYIGATPLAGAAGAGTFIQSGGTNTVSGALSIGCAGGGSGSYTLSGGSVSAATLAITTGGFFSYSGGAGTSASFGSLQLSGSGSMTLSPGSNKTLRVGTISAANTSTLDVSDNRLIATVTSAGTWNGVHYDGVAGLIQSGRNGGAWNGGGGGGIITSQSTARTGNLTSLGVARASDVRPATASATALWGGLTIHGSDTLVMYTYGGDATLDGKINVDDYIRIDSGIASGLTGWSNGDFNYDGKINIDDYTQFIDANIANQGPTFPTATVAGGAAAALPEPSIAIIVVAIIPFAFCPRRRRRLGETA